jgi:hypothetical protein
MSRSQWPVYVSVRYFYSWDCESDLRWGMEVCLLWVLHVGLFSGRCVGESPVTPSSMPFISVSLYFPVLSLMVFVIHFATFCKQIDTHYLQDEVLQKNCDF